MITIRELRKEDEIEGLLKLTKQHVDECAPNLPYDASLVVKQGMALIGDYERSSRNVWIAWEDGKPLGYALGHCSPFYFTAAKGASLHLIYVVPKARGGWSFIKLVKHFEAWAKENGAIRLSVSVERADSDKAKHVRKLFPKMGYQWAGSNYLKE